MKPSSIFPSGIRTPAFQVAKSRSVVPAGFARLLGFIEPGTRRCPSLFRQGNCTALSPRAQLELAHTSNKPVPLMP
jgi:hypothetical protein